MIYFRGNVFSMGVILSLGSTNKNKGNKNKIWNFY